MTSNLTAENAQVHQAAMSTITLPVALTTTFTPAPSCFTDLWLYGDRAVNYWYSMGPPDPSNCFPPSWQSATTSFFSPGVCPQGYSTACASEAISGSMTETSARCCPSGWYCYSHANVNFPGQACATHVTSPGISTITTSAASIITTTAYINTTDFINAFGVEIRWQSTDFVATSTIPSAPTTSSTTSTLASPVSQASPTQSASTSIPGQSDNKNIGLGVGIGVGVAVLLMLGAGAVWYLKKRHSQRDVQYDPSSQWEPPQHKVDPRELYASPMALHEMESKIEPSELYAEPVEMG